MVTFNDADEFFETAAAGGNAFRLKDIKGIGEKTANKINNVRDITGTDDIKQMSADELADKANISRSRAKKAISGLGGNPNVSKTSTSTGSVSAAGFRQAQGDFMVDFADLDKARARNDARSRSEQAVKTDERKRAPVTTDYEKWKGAPSVWDFPGVDTPTQQPDLLPKDLKAGNPATTDFEARDQREKERREAQLPKKVKGGSVLQEEGNRIPAWQVTQDIPEGAVPGLTAQDFEEDPQLPGFDAEAKTMGPEPSSQRLPEPIRQNLAEGVQADMAFMEAEQGRLKPSTSSNGGKGTAKAVVFARRSAVSGQTELNVQSKATGNRSLPVDVRREIKSRVQGMVDIENASGSVAEATLKVKESSGFGDDYEVQSVRKGSDAQLYEFT